MKLIAGRKYHIEVKITNSYDAENQGRRTEKKKAKFVAETDNFYVFQHMNGLRECFSKYTPQGEMVIKPA